METRYLDGHLAAIRCVSFSPDGRHLASASDDWTVRLWNVETGEAGPTLVGHQDSVRCVAWDLSGQRVATGCDSRWVRLFDATTGSQLGALRLGVPVLSLAFAADGRLAAAADQAVIIGPQGTVTRKFPSTSQRSFGVAWSPDQSWLADSHGGFDVSGGEHTCRFALRDPSGGGTAWELEMNGVFTGSGAVQISPDGTLAAMIWGTDEGALLDLRKRQVVGVLHREGLGLQDVTFSPDGRFLAAAGHSQNSGGGLLIWNLETGDESLFYEGVEIESVDWAPNGEVLAVGGSERRVRLLKVDPRVLRSPTCVQVKAPPPTPAALAIDFPPARAKSLRTDAMVAMFMDQHDVGVAKIQEALRLGLPLGDEISARANLSGAMIRSLIARTSAPDLASVFGKGREALEALEQLEQALDLDMTNGEGFFDCPVQRGAAFSRIDLTYRLRAGAAKEKGGDRGLIQYLEPCAARLRRFDPTPCPGMEAMLGLALAKERRPEEAAVHLGRACSAGPGKDDTLPGLLQEARRVLATLPARAAARPVRGTEGQKPQARPQEQKGQRSSPISRRPITVSELPARNVILRRIKDASSTIAEHAAAFEQARGHLREVLARTENESLAQIESRRAQLLEEASSQRALALDAAQARSRSRADQIQEEWEDSQRIWDQKREAFEGRFWWPQWPFSDRTWQTYQPAAGIHIPNTVRIGELALRGQHAQTTVPALVPLFGTGNLFLVAGSAQAEAAQEALRCAVLRLLATLPPGMLRLVLVDPVGLGANLAGFMQLPDELTTDKIWTEPNHIEQRLVDLSEHMEVVIQRHLMNRHESMEEYNLHAEVVEPYRLLVVCNFPTNFSDSAARRLVSIASNGPKTGVYVLMHVDPARPMPYGFELSQLTEHGTVVRHGEDGFHWDHPPFAQLPLTLDRLPPVEIFNRVLATVGAASVDRANVAVPFLRITPDPDTFWTHDSRADLKAPIGRSGVKKSQYLHFGLGTAIHALCIGKTGSGKSTLLHVLVHSLCLHYSPTELELYLVDFKKGVEFREYAEATRRLPHARVIAIQSEREFGVSVLQGLDREMGDRGEKFKKAGVTALKDYRTKRPDEKMPRILLLVDEFQEFFSPDDSMAHQASRIIERLVRQGRSFGIHLILATQALSGHTGLNQATLDQMGIRIALQCSEADSRRILGDDNPAARLLKRPGEAIYNDENGSIEANYNFQVVWFDEQEREANLVRLRELARKKATRLPECVVFDGAAPAVLSDCQGLLRAASTRTTRAPASVRAWLGEPVAIKDSTSCTFRRQSRSNLVVVGQNEEMAAGLMQSILASLAVQLPSEGSEIWFLDFGNLEAPWEPAIRGFLRGMPQTTHHIRKRRDVEATILKLAALVRERAEGEDGSSAPQHFLFINGLHRARDLRKVESSYSFDEPETPSASQEFSYILREGSEAGVHVVAWTDTVAGFERVLERRQIDDFDLRVAMQMGANDSTSVLESEAASKLDNFFALLNDEDHPGQLEKFRPYGWCQPEETLRLCLGNPEVHRVE